MPKNISPRNLQLFWGKVKGFLTANHYTKTESNNLLSGKANTSHSHAIADVTNLQSSLDAKVARIRYRYFNQTVTASNIIFTLPDLELGDIANVYLKINDASNNVLMFHLPTAGTLYAVYTTMTTERDPPYFEITSDYAAYPAGSPIINNLVSGTAVRCYVVTRLT